ncbi:MAG: hypothetical protein H0U74_15865 [Bradymonadaceae bacterium]|nr:hypothetical protein [Lujinxingiaceae bacterium]
MRQVFSIYVLLALALLVAGCNLHFDVESVTPPGVNTVDAGADGVDEPGEELEDCTAPGALECAPGCRDTLTDPWHCGGCDVQCAGFESCSQGQCTASSCAAMSGPQTTCDPVNQTGACNFDRHACALRLVFAGGAPSHFAVECLDTLQGEPTPVGVSCTQANECVGGAYCVGWELPDARSRVCSRFCDMVTGNGCSDDAFCTNPYGELLEGVGFCTLRCDPLDARACPTGSSCTPDFDHPANSCHANFRCTQSGGHASKREASFCDPSKLHTDGCPAGLICMGDRCSKPCATSADCPDSACRQAPAPWSYARFCELD